MQKISNDKKQLLITLKKAHSHLGKIIKMVEEDSYCIDVIQQLNAINGYINSAKYQKLKSHMHTCFIENMSKDKKTKEKYINEILHLFKMTKIT